MTDIFVGPRHALPQTVLPQNPLSITTHRCQYWYDLIYILWCVYCIIVYTLSIIKGYRIGIRRLFIFFNFQSGVRVPDPTLQKILI